MTSVIENIVGRIREIVQGPLSKAEVDIKLSGVAEHRTEQLDWRRSVVDLLKLLDLDASVGAREILAGELGFPGHYTGTPADNTTLHRLVMDYVAKHFTMIPKV